MQDFILTRPELVRSVPDCEPTGDTPPVELDVLLVLANAAALVAVFALPTACATDAVLRLVTALA